MNTLDNQYHTLLQRVLRYGIQKDDRTGTGTLSVFGGQFIHEMSEGFPLLTTKKMAVKTMMTELKWFLKGDTNIKYLVDNGCNIWNGDAYRKYKEDKQGLAMSMEAFIKNIKTNDEFARTWGELGPIYGKQWRDWNGNDQIQNLIKGLKENPDSRRHMVSAWNVGELDGMTLPPCHYGFQVYTRPTTREEKITNPSKYRAISLMWNQRSVDTFLGLPFNITSYGTLLQLLADECDMVADQLIGNLGDIHIYNNHIDAVNEQLSRTSFELPTIEFSDVDILNGEFDYKLNGYESHPSIKAPLSN